MKKLALLTTLFWLLISGTAWSATHIGGLRMWTAPDHTRLVFDISQPVQHKLFRLHKPERLVIDFEQARLNQALDTSKYKNRHISGIRYAPQDKNGLRVVLDLTKAVRPKSFVLKPNQQYGHRLVIDIYDQAGDPSAKPVAVKSTEQQTGLRDVVVAIDAGHGGEDPGAIGRKLKTQEKVVTLAIAKKLKKLIDAEPGMRGVLTRKGDYYVGLRNRMKLARAKRADLFVSIHADAFRNTKARGSSVYVLSQRGASSEAARWLAAKENASDLAGGVSLDDKDDMLASVLLDLSQTGTRAASLTAANQVYGEMGRISKRHGNRVQHAGFLVLKSPDIPSMLVETGFISNPTEERNLASSNYQQKMANAIFKGIKRYFNQAPPVGTRLASLKNSKPEQYVIKRGDTLSEIASRHQVTLVALRQENRIKGDRIRVGQVIRIPKT